MRTGAPALDRLEASFTFTMSVLSGLFVFFSSSCPVCYYATVRASLIINYQK